MGSKTMLPPQEAFDKRYIPEPTSGCWLWEGQYMNDGYGVFSSKYGREEKRVTLAHRASWELHRGPIPDGLFVCHRCDNRACVNPDHLFLGTNQDNMDDMKRKGRAPTNKGIKNPRARLNPLSVGAIKSMLRRGIPVKNIVPIFSVTKETIHAIKQGRVWQDVA